MLARRSLAMVLVFVAGLALLGTSKVLSPSRPRLQARAGAPAAPLAPRVARRRSAAALDAAQVEAVAD
ncbi:MAG: hypothetical protein KDD82_30390, partial [Planctomycetes bacterium]|nr:hypothetical protein [Planctomycetota bacterium]